MSVLVQSPTLAKLDDICCWQDRLFDPWALIHDAHKKTSMLLSDLSSESSAVCRTKHVAVRFALHGLHCVLYMLCPAEVLDQSPVQHGQASSFAQEFDTPSDIRARLADLQ
eukprot:2254844-Amphidinium_carterae.1